MRQITLLTFLFLFNFYQSNSQIINQDDLKKGELDSAYIFEVQDKYELDKVLHAEPLYIDLIRDLGARAGEAEWNYGIGIMDQLNYAAYEMLVEYEWAPIDRLGFEIELPFSFYSANGNYPSDSIKVPSSSLESFKLATQWSFFVSEEMATSMAIGYIHEFELSDFSKFGNPLFKGMLYNPFFIAAKRWGNNFHTLIYTGPRIEQSFNTNSYNLSYELHTNFHYMITGTRNFIGLEINKYFHHNDFDLTFRPQMRVGITENFLIGIVGGIPINAENDRFSLFLRLIWEPEHELIGH